MGFGIFAWKSDLSVLECMIALDQLLPGVKPSNPAIMAYAELLRQDLEVGAHLPAFASSSLCSAAEGVYRERGIEVKTASDVYLKLLDDLKNLACLGTLGLNYGNQSQAKHLCIVLHRYICALNVADKRAVHAA